MIRIVIDIGMYDDGTSTGITIATDPFDPSKEHVEVGAAWVGVCHALNAYMRANGSPTFDCLKMRAMQ